MSVVSSPLHDSMTLAEPTPAILPTPTSSSSSSLFGKAKAFCQEEEKKEEKEKEKEKVAVEEMKKTKNPNFSFSSSSSDPACCDSLRRSPILSRSGSSSSSSSPSGDEEGEGDDDYSALVKRFFIDEHASFRVAGNGAQLDALPSSTSNLSLFPQQDSVETRLGSLRFELENELQSGNTDDSFEGLVRRFKIDPYSSNMRSPRPAAAPSSRALVQPSPFPGQASPMIATTTTTPFSPFSPFAHFDLHSLRARSQSISSRSRSRSRSLSRSRADHRPSASTPVPSLDQVLHKRVKGGRVSRFSKKHRRQQQQQQEKQTKTKPRILQRNSKQFQNPAASSTVSRALFPTSKPSSQKKKQRQGKARPLTPPLVEITPRPRKLELLQSTQRLMSIFRPPMTSSAW